MIDSDYHWLAGLLEGEGSFLKPPPSSPGSPQVSVQMTDLDVILRVEGLLGIRHTICLPKESHHKISYTVRLRGGRAARLMIRLRPLMGTRRQGQIDRALAAWDRSKDRYKVPISSDDVLALHASGKSQRTIAKILGCGRGTVQHIINRGGLSLAAQHSKNLGL
jgi:hypothetical protein